MIKVADEQYGLYSWIFPWKKGVDVRLDYCGGGHEITIMTSGWFSSKKRVELYSLSAYRLCKFVNSKWVHVVDGDPGFELWLWDLVDQRRDEALRRRI